MLQNLVKSNIYLIYLVLQNQLLKIIMWFLTSFSYNVGPCNDINYATLDDPNRNRYYNGGDASPSCDQNAVQGDWKGGDVWYRFAGPAGSQLADSIVPTHHCGTLATGWLNGAHPVFLGENVTRQVCFHWDGNSCNWNTDVDIKQCGGFYIYKFKAVPGCEFKYCGQWVVIHFCEI